jgi:hypothetical protein
MTTEEEYLKAADELREYFKINAVPNDLAAGGMCILIGQMLGENASSRDSLDFGLMLHKALIDTTAALSFQSTQAKSKSEATS